MHRPHFSEAGGLSPANASFAFPIRAAYYFPWYDEGWDQLGYTPFTRYTPTLGAYHDQHDPAIIQQHLTWAKYANIDALVLVWRGRADGVGISATTFSTLPNEGQRGTDEKVPVILDQCLQHGLKACIMYEVEGYADPSAAQIEAELDYLAAYFSHPAYLQVDERPVIFVYSAANASNALAGKYSTATAGFTNAYIMLQTTSASSTSPAVDGLYRFHSTRAESVSNSYSICPGFWRIDQVNPVTARDLAAWEANISDMVASGKDWHLIVSWNEWGEGSQVEPSVEFGRDTAYLDALAAVP